MNLLFLGTPAFAVPTLERAAEAGHRILGVFTQPDRPKGRGQRDAMPPVKEAALRLGVTVHQPERIRRPEVVEQIREMAPDLIVVVGYGQILPQSILDIPPHGTINVHASLLPKYRGAAPIQWAVANGEARTGVTTMLLNAGLDTGDMLLKWETEIGPEETAVELGERLAIRGADLLVQTLAQLPSIRPEPQDHSQSSYAPILKKEDGHIDWSLPASDILNRIRGFQPWPGCYGFLRDQRLHIWKAGSLDRTLPPGSLSAEHRHLLAGTGSGALDILEIQMEGKKRMPAAAFLNGFTLQSSEVFA
jgi:methionyl-tRNA formyltransferase